MTVDLPQMGARARVASRLLFITLEWAAASDEHVEAILSDPATELDFVRHHLRAARRWRRYSTTPGRMETRMIAKMTSVKF